MTSLNNKLLWEKTRLDEVAKLDCQSIHPSDILDQTAYLGLEHLNGEGGINLAETVASADLKSNKYKFSRHHILYGKLRPYLRKISRPDFEGICSTDIIPILPGEKISRNYLFHFLRTPLMVQLATNQSSGANLPRLNPKRLASFHIPLPPLSEQKRIAGILDKADALRVKRRESLSLLDNLIQSTFLDIFGDPVMNPMGWDVHALENLGNVQTGGTPPSKFEGMFDGGIPFVTPGDLTEKWVVSARTVTEAGAKKSKTVNKGATFVCCIGATIGKMGKASTHSAFNQQINAVSWRDAVVDDFGLEAMKFFKSKIIKDGASTTLPILKKSLFQKICIPVPPLSLQRRFAAIVESIEKQKARLKAHLAELDNLFASLQQRAFNGEL